MPLWDAIIYCIELLWSQHEGLTGCWGKDKAERAERLQTECHSPMPFIVTRVQMVQLNLLACLERHTAGSAQSANIDNLIILVIALYLYNISIITQSSSVRIVVGFEARSWDAGEEFMKQYFLAFGESGNCNPLLHCQRQLAVRFLNEMNGNEFWSADEVIGLQGFSKPCGQSAHTERHSILEEWVTMRSTTRIPRITAREADSGMDLFIFILLNLNWQSPKG